MVVMKDEKSVENWVALMVELWEHSLVEWKDVQKVDLMDS